MESARESNVMATLSSVPERFQMLVRGATNREIQVSRVIHSWRAVRNSLACVCAADCCRHHSGHGFSNSNALQESEPRVSFIAGQCASSGLIGASSYRGGVAHL